MSLTFGLAGSTARTVQSSQSLLDSGKFTLRWVTTPLPKPVGRKQLVEPNPVHNLAKELQIPVVSIHKKIDEATKKRFFELPEIDFLLVVDFGYLVPSWLLKLPKTAPINIHPSALPRWRGSSPGQFCLLYGDAISATTIMIMNESLDEGPILKQTPFTVDRNWTQTEYYQTGFKHAAANLPSTLLGLADGTISPQDQPKTSPTPIAHQLKKNDAFLSWEMVTALMNGRPVANKNLLETSQLLQAAAKESSWLKTIERASRAFWPWPVLWTQVPTTKGPKRMKIIEVAVSKTNLILKKVQIEGQDPAQWNQVKNAVLQEMK